MLLSLIVKKQSDTTNKKKKDDSDDDEHEEAKENTLAALESEASKAELLLFYTRVVLQCAPLELKVPDDDAQFEDAHSTTFGVSTKPFGGMRTALVEFLADLHRVHHERIHNAFEEADLYNSLLFFFEYHPYHNVLHQKVCDIFIEGLERNIDAVVNHFLYQTSLIKRVLETSRDFGSGVGGFLVFEGGNKVARGFLVFMRRIANKLIESQKQNEEISSFLESIPEWADYFENELKKVNEMESKPLGQDPRNRKKSEQNEDDIFVQNFLNRFNKQQEKERAEKEALKNLQGGDDDDDEGDDELKHSDSYERSGRVDPDEDLLEVGAYDENLLDDDTAQEENQVRDRQQYRSNHHREHEEEVTTGAWAGHENDDPRDDLLDRLLCKNETLEDGDAYYATAAVKRVKARGLSFDDLAASPESDQKSASFKSKRLKQINEGVEKPEYHSNVYWSNVEVISNDQLDDLLADYQ